MDLPIEKKEPKVPRSFTLQRDTITMIEEYAVLKGVSASQVVDTMATHFLTRILQQEKAKGGAA